MERVERLEGWKALVLNGSRLCSPNGGFVWPLKQPMAATCTRSLGEHRVEAPQGHCTCGIYAAWTPAGAMPYMFDVVDHVLCKVRVPVGGRAFAGDEAWRADRVEIEAIIAIHPEGAFTLAPVAERYGVPLLFWPEGGQYLAETFGGPHDPERSLKYFDGRAHRRAKKPYWCKDCRTGIRPGDFYYCLGMSHTRRRYCGDCGAQLRLLYVRSLQDWEKAGRPKKWNMNLQRYRKEVGR